MHKKQNGSAATGFMVGLLVGLLIAVVIAFFVAKVPVKAFGTSAYPTGQGTDAEGAATGPIPADPNAVLYSRQVPSLPATGFSGSQTTVSTVAGQEQSDPNAGLAPVESNALPPDTAASSNNAATSAADKAAQAKASVDTKNNTQPKPKDAAQAASAKSTASGNNAATTNSTTAPKADPLAEIIKAKDKAATATNGSTSAAASAFDYYVQAGAFRNKQEAEQVRAKLQSLGVSARLSERVQGDGTVYRVRSGPFPQRSTADSARNKVTSSGMDAVIVSVPR